MKTFKIIRHSSWWSTGSLTDKVERTLAAKTAEGWEIVTVSFGIDLWHKPTAFITFSKDNAFV